VSVGLSVTGGISRLLPLLVGPVRAKELLLLGDRIGAARALELGLVNRVAAAGLNPGRVTRPGPGARGCGEPWSCPNAGKLSRICTG
jgi:enoyl-CoA hydratase/carnithine racemase